MNHFMKNTKMRCIPEGNCEESRVLALFLETPIVLSGLKGARRTPLTCRGHQPESPEREMYVWAFVFPHVSASQPVMERYTAEACRPCALGGNCSSVPLRYTHSHVRHTSECCVPTRLAQWTLKTELHVLFMCHKIFLF